MSINLNTRVSIFIISSMISINFANEISNITGKLSISNISQILITLILFIIIKPSLNILILISFFIASSLISMLFNILFNFDEPKFYILLFMTASILYVSYGYVFLTKNNYLHTTIENSITKSIYFIIPIYIFMYYIQSKSGDVFNINYGMDDKSHSAILLCFFSFISLLYVKKFAFIIGFFFLLMSMLTISRLPFIFAPFFMLAATIHAVLSSKNKSESILKILFILILLTCAAFLMLENQETFKVLERFSFNDGTSLEKSPSSQAHDLLIKKAIELKQLNLGNFIFGVSPGAFADTLVRSPINYSDLAILDPQFIEFAFIGKAPVHSTHMAFYSEYPIWIFSLYVLINCYIGYALIKNRNWITLLFFIPFNLATTYYSSHNKFYYYFIFLILLILCKLDYNIIKQKNTLLTHK